MSDYELECVWQISSVLGEGPVWVARENAVYWVDIIGKAVHRLAWVDGSRSRSGPRHALHHHRPPPARRRDPGTPPTGGEPVPL